MLNALCWRMSGPTVLMCLFCCPFRNAPLSITGLGERISIDWFQFTHLFHAVPMKVMLFRMSFQKSGKVKHLWCISVGNCPILGNNKLIVDLVLQIWLFLSNHSRSCYCSLDTPLTEAKEPPDQCFFCSCLCWAACLCLRDNGYCLLTSTEFQSRRTFNLFLQRPHRFLLTWSNFFPWMVNAAWLPSAMQ